MAAAPPLLLIIAFKIYISRTAERQFRYYEASPEEMEQEKMYSMSEKPTKQSEVENRFLHPALQHNKLFTVMVHKSQESLAREVLSAYPWFAGKHEGDGVKIKAVREVSLRGLLCGPVFYFDFDFFRKTSSTILRAMDRRTKRTKRTGMRNRSHRRISSPNRNTLLPPRRITTKPTGITHCCRLRILPPWRLRVYHCCLWITRRRTGCYRLTTGPSSL